MQNASRAQIDLEALARDLRHEGTAARPADKADPLAELARIVGQDDPFRALLEARNEIGANFVEPHPAAPAGWDRPAEVRLGSDDAARSTPADAFDQYLASVERDMHRRQPEADAQVPYASDEPSEPYDDARALRRASPRRRLLSVGAGIAVVAVAVTGALTYKGLHSTASTEVPVVEADKTPMKVAPKVADGVEIPDQNRQIYDRNATGKDGGQIKIVNREEQPLDVAEAARAAGGPPANAGTTPGTTPGNSPFDAFGEPRRVRTVAVKPEAPPAPPPAPVEAPAQAEQAPMTSPVPTMVLPTADPAPAPARPVRTVRSADALGAPITTTAEPVAEAPARPQPKPAPAPVAVKKAPQRVASIDATQTSPETTQATSAAIDTTSPVGGYAVQLGVRNSASDARAALHQFQAKFGQLAGKPELIRQAEVNGKTIFRVRVGPLAKDEASSLCSALQGEGGQCFVAKN